MWERSKHPATVSPYLAFPLTLSGLNQQMTNLYFFFFFFLHKTGFGISSKSFLVNLMSNLFSWKKYFNVSSAENFTQSA